MTMKSTNVKRSAPPRNSRKSEPAKGTPARLTPLNNGTDRVRNSAGADLATEEKGTGC